MKPFLDHKVMHFYRAYGITFASEIVLPELITAPPTTSPDVTIRLGTVPPSLPNPMLQKHDFDLTESQFRFEVKDVASYLVTNGRAMIIQPLINSRADDVRTFLLGTCFGVLLHQRNILPIHASAIETEWGAVLFMGESGRGKSTLLNAFLQRGYNMLTDDVAGIILDNQGRPLLLPGLPQTKLHLDVIQNLNQSIKADDRQQPDGKFYRQPRHQFRISPQTIWRVYWLADSATDDRLDISLLTPYRALETVVHNIYCQATLVRRTQRQSNFSQLSALVGAVKLYQLTRPKSLKQLTTFVDLIEQHFQRRL